MQKNVEAVDDDQEVGSRSRKTEKMKMDDDMWQTTEQFN